LSEKYQLVRMLGEGGMGAVYEARHKVVGRRFAVKFLHAEYAQKTDVMARFRREAEAPGPLECEHIAAVLDFGTASDGAPFIVMEYLDGEDLHSLLKREPRLPVRRAAEIAVQVCRGLEVAHNAGIVHRDLKPANIFLSRRSDGTDLVKLVDFGIAKLLESARSGINTATGTLVGTLYYMAPEQARGDKLIDRRADTYALGATLYEALSGELPHPGTEQHAVLFHIVYEPFVPLKSRRPELPDALCQVVEKAIAKERDERFQSARELANALLPFANPEARAPSAMAFAAESAHAATVAAREPEPSVAMDQTQPAASADSPGPTPSPAVTPAVLTKQSEPTAQSLAGTAATLPVKRVVPMWVTPVVGAVAIVGGLGLWLFRSDAETEESRVEPSAPTAEHPHPEGVLITVTGAPPGAKIYYEGAFVPMNPFRVKLGETITPLHIEAQGYEPFTTSVVPSRDHTVAVALKALAAPSVEVSPVETEAPPIRQTPSPATPRPPAQPKPASAPPPSPPEQPKPKFKPGKSGAEFTEEFE